MFLTENVAGNLNLSSSQSKPVFQASQIPNMYQCKIADHFSHQNAGSSYMSVRA